MPLIFYICVFLFGLCIASFLNCVIYRFELQEKMPAGPGRKAVSFLRGKSFCPHCKHTLSWQDLFPIFSFLFLKGKCRYCQAKISIQYPLVEIATALIFLLILHFKFQILNEFFNFKFLNVVDIIFWFYIASVLIIIFVYDSKHYLIPDAVLLPAIAIALIYKFFINLSFSHWNLIENLKFKIENSASILGLISAVVIASGLFFLIWLVSRGRWMGFGDVKLAVLLGLITGFPNILVALYSAFFFGAIIGIILMFNGKKKLKSEIPFGPFLIAGTFLALFWGDKIIKWYLQLFNV